MAKKTPLTKKTIKKEIITDEAISRHSVEGEIKRAGESRSKMLTKKSGRETDARKQPVVEFVKPRWILIKASLHSAPTSLPS